MLLNTIKICVVVLLLRTASPSQELTELDFRVGGMIVGAKMDSISLIDICGSCQRVDPFIHAHRSAPPDTSYLYCFDSCTVVIERWTIKRFEFESKGLVTYRGIRVGDTPDKIKKAYGEPSPEHWHGHSTETNEKVFSYFRGKSTLGISFYLQNGVVRRIIIGWGGT